MQDKSQQGLGYLAASLVPATIAVVSKDPLVKFIASLGVVWAIGKASDCFKDTAKHAYYQLVQAPENRLLH